MLDLTEKLKHIARQQAKWKGLIDKAKSLAPTLPRAPIVLIETDDFGANPGALRMFSHVPSGLGADAPLVVVLHGCSQTAAAYDTGAGWSTLADRYGFALLYPEQQASNNANLCFNWFVSGDTQRGQGEPASIRAMIETMVAEHQLDMDRIFITGLSAGGAMASVMLAIYPEVFAAGAIIAGLPHGAAKNVQEAFEAMFQAPARPAPAWGDMVRRASPHSGPWPRVSVWHGDADRTVVPANAKEIVKQWRDVHGLPEAPTLTEAVNGHARDVWRDATGADVIESYTIEGMAHGTPLSVGEGDDQAGTASAFLIEAGISSTFHAAKFFGIAAAHTAAVQQKKSPALRPRAKVTDEPRRERPAKQAPKLPAGVDVHGVITRALTAAGLMKR